MSINIGLTIAASATVSRAVGAGDRARARRLAASSLAVTAVFAAVASAGMFVFRDWALAHVVHASGEPLAVASRFLAITLPANVLLALGFVMSGLLRAVGDARRAMYVTLSGAIVTAFLDPALIYGLGLGVYGAAWATVASRVCFLMVGFHGSVVVHDIVARPDLRAARRDFGPIMAIGFPAIMANLATPVGAAYTVRIFSDVGEAAIASGAIIDRVTPVAFGVIFALTGSVGPIIGQNYGARLIGRVQRTLERLLSAVDRLRAGRLGRARGGDAVDPGCLRRHRRERRATSPSTAGSGSSPGSSSPACSSPTRRSTTSAFRS